MEQRLKCNNEAAHIVENSQQGRSTKINVG